MTEISAMYEALDNMDDYALMANVKPIGPHKVLTDAIAELEQLRQRVQELEERRCEICGYAEHHREHTGCLRVQVKELTAERDALKSEQAARAAFNDVSALTAERDQLRTRLLQKMDDCVKAEKDRDALKKLYESSEESVLALKETRNRVAEDRDALEQQIDALVEAAIMAVEMIEYNKHERRHVRRQLNDAIASVKEKS